MFCFSGLNLFPGPDGNLGILDSDPVSGGGDIGFFPVTNQTYFAHDRRFERFRRGSLRREFAGFLYWHLKYLKRDMGFGNYELDKNPQSRYARRHTALQNGHGNAIDLKQLSRVRTPGLAMKMLGLFSEKRRWWPVEMQPSRRRFRMAVCAKRLSGRLNVNSMLT
jgi:hypothetical protein